MSGLAAVLAGRREAGVWTWHGAASPADVRHAVEHAGWTFGHVDGWTHGGKAAFLGAVGQALAFPAWYGANLDALRDSLWDTAPRTLLLWDGWGTLARDDEAAFAAVLEILQERSTEDPPFVALLRGEGPPEAVASVGSLDA